MKGVRSSLALAGLALLTVACASAPEASAGARGRWRFTDADRPVKAVVLGGSISAYRFGSYGQYLQAVCERVEVVNRAKSRLGATALRDRFEDEVLRNRRVDPKDYESMWLVFFGGLNSIGSPQLTNLRVAETMKAAHDAGIRTVALSIGPWGSDRDRRWAGAKGLEYLDHTERAVDFVLGRSTPEEALGRYAQGRAAWEEGELPEIAVDLWSTGLRDGDAPLRERGRMARLVPKSRWVRRRLAKLADDARAAALQAMIERAVALPRTYMKRDLVGFDAIHPNTRGHRVIALEACGRLPAEWGCDCEALTRARWDRKARAVRFDEPGTAQ